MNDPKILTDKIKNLQEKQNICAQNKTIKHLTILKFKQRKNFANI